MEVVGLIASAAQISVYACSIVSLISEIRSAARNGPLLLQERSQQLVVLGFAVEKIRLDTALHTDVLSGYLLTIQHKIRNLHDLVRLRSSRPTNSSAQRLRTALSFVTRNKEVESSFATLQDHCQTLYFYMNSTGSRQYDGSRTAPIRTQESEERLIRRHNQPALDDPGKELTPPRDRRAFPAMDDAGKQLAPPRAQRPSQASSTPAREPLIHNAPARESSARSQGHGGRFIGNSAGENSRQWFGNHASGSVELRDQIFEQNVVTKDGDQIFGSSLVPGGKRPERSGSDRDDKKQASK